MRNFKNMDRREPTLHVELSHEDPDDVLLAGDIFSSGKFYNVITGELLIMFSSQNNVFAAGEKVDQRS